MSLPAHTFVREDPAGWRLTSANEIEIFGADGSIWGTLEDRKKWFGKAEPPVTNILVLTEEFGQATVAVDLVPKVFGSQAGLVFYANDSNYIKFVVEGNKTNGTMFIFAQQINDVPEVLAKVDFDSSHPANPISLRLTSSAEGVKAEYNLGHTWVTVLNSESLPCLASVPHSQPRFGLMTNSVNDWVKFSAFSVQ
eukprot:c1870_g1_i1.p1 GENE.c1870_g1_i1~~c1870_g1_i1.p1  ORF type:complete len:195 (+),score=38.05 c1870_g1_i1:38-622(+)